MISNKIIFIVNPVAGQGTGEKSIPEINRLATEYLGNYEIAITKYPGHASELAYQNITNGINTVVAVGGDGTANEVLNGLMKAWKEGYKESTMGVIGIGRGNDFAYGVGIPAGLQEGFDTVKKYNLHPLDVGLISGGDYPQGRFFGNGVGIGFDAVVGFEAAKLTHIHGFMNYVVAALRTIFLFFHAPNIKIEYDKQVLTQPCLMISIMNGRRMGGGFMMAPNASTEDGIFNLCIAGQVSRLGILKLIPKFMKGIQASHPQIKTGNAEKIHIVALEGSLPVHADGETICVAGKELTIELYKQPLKILAG